MLAVLSAPQITDATWSIVLANAETGEVAVGTVTCLNNFDLLAIVPVVVVGKGGGAVQSAGDFDGIRRPVIFEHLGLGTPPEEILEILSAISGHQQRQYGITDTTGGKVTFSGSSNGAWAGGVTGSQCSLHYAIQGNVLAGSCVVEAIEQAVLDTAGDIPARLMAGMQAARAMGGDGRCSCQPFDPTACGCPVVGKSGHIGGMVVARIGDVDDDVCNAGGCVDGDYFMRLNVAFQDNAQPDPVVQLQMQFDAWRSALVGRPDAVRSMVTLDPPTIPPDGSSTTTMNITLLDWQGEPINVQIDSVAVAHSPDSAGLSTIGAPVDNKDGTFSVTITAGLKMGLDRFRVTVDDGIRPVVLTPDPALEYCTPPACQLDCNNNGVTDSCDIGDGVSGDCNGNGVPDECDTAFGDSVDCDGDFVPDECEPDCNNNDTADDCDIADGTSSDIDGNGVPDDCHGIHRVPSVFSTIQGAIDVAKAGDTVLIADGTYTGAGNRDLDFGGKDILVKSENGPETCVIDCASAGRGFIFQSGESRSAALDGLTIVNGQADLGGAINCVAGSDPTIRDCVLALGVASDKGGGLHAALSSPRLVRTRLLANSAGGARGGGGLYVAGESDQPLQVDNCLFVGNSANRGGAMYIYSSAIEVRHCTFSENQANGGGAAYATVLSHPKFTNCILWGDTSEDGPEILLGSSVTIVSIDYSNVEGGAAGIAGSGTVNWGDGSIGEDPVKHDPAFADPDGPDDEPATTDDNDYHLLSGSPSIDSGDPDYAPDANATDLDGQARLIDGDGDGVSRVDMGCFEHQLCPADLDGNGTVGPFDLASLLGAWGPNPGHPADLDGDGAVGALDLAILLGQWGPCL
jgi:uncharacterized Ntn-hydrolase superfamily protein